MEADINRMGGDIWNRETFQINGKKIERNIPRLPSSVRRNRMPEDRYPVLPLTKILRKLSQIIFLF
jgi:hypothetical protein